jgi:hypothetical protein
MDLWDSKPMVNLDSCQKQPVLIDILVNSDADMGSMMKSPSSREKKNHHWGIGDDSNG